MSDVNPKISQMVIYVPAAPLPVKDGETPVPSPEANNKATEVPAVIVRAWNDGVVNLKIFTDGPETTWRTSVHHCDNNSENSWHYPVAD